MTVIGEHAVVLGASMAGLLTARVLADRFERVTIVERDRLPEGDAHRVGVPQSRHVHGLLAAGREAIEALLPGIVEEIQACGGHSRDSAAVGRWFNAGRYTCQVEAGVRGLAVTRPVLEGHVRRRVLALPNVALRDWCAAQGLDASGDGRRVTGVRLRPRDAGAADEHMGADLVVDATGRASRADDWLQQLGYAPPAQDRVEVGLGYASRLYRRSPTDLDGDTLLTIAAMPPNRRMGIALAVEGDRWMVTLAGLLGDHPPTDDAGFLRFAAGFPTRDLHDLIAGLEPLTDPVRTRFPAHRRMRFERLRRLPDGFLAVGDAICSFNPVYGQGMSVAAKEAVLLARCLDDGALHALPRRFFRAAAPVVDVPWDIAVGSDLRFAEVDGPRTLRTRVINRYMRRLLTVAADDPVVARAFFRVGNLVDEPSELLRFGVARRVLAGGRPRPSATATAHPGGGEEIRPAARTAG